MSVLRQLNLLSQMRLDVPHLRTLDSSVAGDFDTVIGRVAAGERALVVRGFTMSNVGGVAATALELNTADAILYNLNASESGSFLWVPSDRTAEVLDPTSNGTIDGSWTSNAVNYVGLDLLRSADSDTTDIVQFKDANTGLETPRSVPTAKTLDYRIVISTTPFASQANLVPIAKVTLNGSGVVTAMSDSRNMMFRLGRGGDSPDAEYAHSWAASRAESTALDNTLFVGADKAISSEKEWMDSIMTRLWELGGGEYWYSATSDRNCTQVNTGTPFANGEYFFWDDTLTPGTYHLWWKDLVILFDNSTAYYNTVSGQGSNSVGLTDLDDGECIYVEVDRTTNAAALTAQKGDLATLSAGTPPGSMWVIAWRYGTEVFTRGSKYAVGNWISVATASSTGIVKLSRTASTPSSPIVISDKGGTISAAGLLAVGLAVTGGDSAGTGAAAVQGTGGAGTVAAGAGFYGTGGAGTGIQGGDGVTGIGGAGVDTYGGTGLVGYGATGVANGGGYGIYGLGGILTTAPGDGIIGVGRGMDSSIAAVTAYDRGGNGGIFLGGLTTSNTPSFFGIGVIGRGGTNGTYQGTYSVTLGVPLPSPGTGVVGIGGSGVGGGGIQYGGDGGQFFGIGHDGTTGRAGAIGQGFITSSAITGGGGLYGAGGAASSSGAGGYGVAGVGGANSSTGDGGAGLVGTGGTSGDGTGGHGVVGTGGASTSGNPGAGGVFTGANTTAAAVGANGSEGTGGTNDASGAAGHGVKGTGGANSDSGAAGHGVYGIGGNSTSGTDGYGGYFVGGGGGGGVFGQANSTTSAAAVVGTQGGSGNAGYFENTGTGKGIAVLSTGTVAAASFTNGSATSSVVLVDGYVEVNHTIQSSSTLITPARVSKNKMSGGWGTIDCSPLSVLDGMNITSVAADGDDLVITWAWNVYGTGYPAVIPTISANTGAPAPGYVVSIHSAQEATDKTRITALAHNGVTTSRITLNGSGYSVSVVVFTNG